MSKKNIKLYSTENEEKSSVVERFNRTIKEKMWKMLSANNNTIYFDKIGELLKNYNSSLHQSVRMHRLPQAILKIQTKFLPIYIRMRFSKKLKSQNLKLVKEFVFQNTNENFSIKDLLQTGLKKSLLLMAYYTQNQSLIG